MTPILVRWEGDALVPVGRSQRDCDDALVIGETYRFERIEERSDASHRHYFAAINEAWANLPERLAKEYPSAEALRKKALIATGYSTQQQYVAGSKKEAMRMAPFIASLDVYCVVVVTGNVITILHAESQSYRAMGKKRFQESKDAVLDWIAALVGVETKELEQNAGKAA